MALESIRKLTDAVFNGMLIQECVAAENYFKTEDLHGVAPTVLRAVYLTDVIGEAPFIQTLPIETGEQQAEIIREGARAVDDNYGLAAVLFMTSMKYANPDNSDEPLLKLIIAGRTPDQRKNLAIYDYIKDEDDRYYIQQETLMPYSPTTEIDLEVPAIDAYIKEFNYHRLMIK